MVLSKVAAPVAVAEVLFVETEVEFVGTVVVFLGVRWHADAVQIWAATADRPRITLVVQRKEGMVEINDRTQAK